MERVGGRPKLFAAWEASEEGTTLVLFADVGLALRGGCIGAGERHFDERRLPDRIDGRIAESRHHQDERLGPFLNIELE